MVMPSSLGPPWALAQFDLSHFACTRYDHGRLNDEKHFDRYGARGGKDDDRRGSNPLVRLDPVGRGVPRFT
jgi:hypothetical protein